MTKRILVTGATGYIGSAVADALRARGHDVFGLARSKTSADTLRSRGIEALAGDFGDLRSLTQAVSSAAPDVVVSTASTGATAGDTAASFARDRDAVRALQAGLTSTHQTLLFTSGSAVFGVFADGDASNEVYGEDTPLPLAREVFAPNASAVPEMLATGFGAAMAARVATEQAVLNPPRGHGVVLRPGLVYGNGGSYDLPALISRSRRHGRGIHVGTGDTTQGFVHLDDLAELYCLAVETEVHDAVLHGVTAEITELDLARAVSRLLGAGYQTTSLTLHEVLALSPAEQIGITVAGLMPRGLQRRLSAKINPSPDLGTALSLAMNKRLSSRITRELTGWSPARRDILDDVSSGSYATQ